MHRNISVLNCILARIWVSKPKSGGHEILFQTLRTFLCLKSKVITLSQQSFTCSWMVMLWSLEKACEGKEAGGNSPDQSSSHISFSPAKSWRLRSTKCLYMECFHPSWHQKLWQIYLLSLGHSTSCAKWVGLLLFVTPLNLALCKAVCEGNREELYCFKEPMKLQTSLIYLRVMNGPNPVISDWCDGKEI